MALGLEYTRTTTRNYESTYMGEGGAFLFCFVFWFGAMSGWAQGSLLEVLGAHIRGAAKGPWWGRGSKGVKENSLTPARFC